MVEEEMEEERKREGSQEATSSFNPKPKVTQSQIEKFKELNKKMLQLKETNNQNNEKTKLKGSSSTRKRPCLELESKGKKDASMPIKYTKPEEHQNEVSEPAQLDYGPAPQKYKRKLHWGLDTKERWERKSNM